MNASTFINNEKSSPFSFVIPYDSFEHIKSFVEDPPMDTPCFHSHFKSIYDPIKIMDSCLITIADLEDEFQGKNSFKLFKKTCHLLQELILKPIHEALILKDCGNIKEKQSISYYDKEKGSIQAEIVMKWWKTYLSILQEVFEYKFSEEEIVEDDWSDKNNEWFDEKDRFFLEQALRCLEKYHHWKIMLLRTLYGKEDFFKILSSEGLMKKDFERNFNDDYGECFKYFKERITNNLIEIERMENNSLSLLMKESLQLILEKMNCQKSLSLCAIAMKAGLFSKKKIEGLKHSVVLAENGGFFLLMNSASPEEKEILLKNGIEKDYLERITSSNKISKLVIGRGSFGKIRICIALSNNETSNILKPGEIICCKKTKSLITDSMSMNEIRTHCLNDYSAGVINEMVYSIFSPEVYDMLIIDPLKNTTKKISKGYTFQQFLPVLDGFHAFIENNSPFKMNWLHQRAYFIHIFAGISELLNRGICMTDIKPQNTLYNPKTFQGFLIDLSGVVIKKSRKELEDDCTFGDIKERSDRYSAPEIKSCVKGDEEYDYAAHIDLCKSIAFSLGIMLQETIFEETIKTQITPIFEKLIEEDPLNRISVEEGLELLKSIPPPSSKLHVDFSVYIKKLGTEIKKTPEKFGLHKDYELIKQSLIELKASSVDIERYPDAEGQISFTKLSEDLSNFKENSKEIVFVLLGTSGSGKSTVLQIEYWNSLQNWQEGDPIPIFINLSVQTNLELLWKNTCKEIGLETDDILNDFNNFIVIGYPVILFIDSFDEAATKINYVSYFCKALGNNSRNKAIICCRSEYLQNDEDFIKYFVPNRQDSQTLRRFIVPLKKAGFVLNEHFINSYYSVWNTKNTKENEEAKTTIENYKDLTDKLLDPNILQFMTTGFMIHITLMIFPRILRKESGVDIAKKINKNKIFKKYTRQIIKRCDQKVKKACYRSFIGEIPNESEEKNDLDPKKWLHSTEKVALLLASLLYSNDSTSKITQISGPAFFAKLNYSTNIACFKNELLVGAIRSLDLVTEVKGTVPKEEILIGFPHDTIKNYYLVRYFEEECRWRLKNNEEKAHKWILGKRIISDEVLMKFAAEVVKEKADFKGNLLEVLMKSKTPNENHEKDAAIAAANAISILIAANVSFSNRDLRKVKIPGAILRDAQFSNADFTEADLSDTIMENCKLDGALFDRTLMKNVNLGVLLDKTMGSAVTSCCLSKKGTEIVSGCEDSCIKIYDQMNSQTNNVKSLGGHHIGIFSPDGQEILGNSGCALNLWEKSMEKVVQCFEGHTDRVKSIGFSPDGLYIVSGSEDNKVKLWEKSKGTLLNTLKSHSNSVNSVAFSTDGQYILSGSSDNTIKLWEKSTGTLVKTFESHTDSVNSAAFSPNGQWILSGSSDKTIKLWGKNDGNLAKTFVSHKDSVNCVAFSPSSEHILSGSDDNTIKLWEISPEKLLKTFTHHTNSVLAAMFSPSGRHILSGSCDKTVKLLEISTGAIKTFESHANRVVSVAFSPDGLSFLSGSDDCSLKIWTTTPPNLAKTLESHSSAVNCIALSHDEQYIVSGSSDKTAKLWEKQTGKLLKTFKGHGLAVNSVAFSPNDEEIVSGSEDATVKLWTKSTETPQKSLDGHALSVTSVAVSPDGTLIASGSKDKTVKIWGKSGKSLGNLIKTLEGHGDWVNSVAFSSKTQHIVSGSYDKSIKIWEVSTGMLLKTLNSHTFAVNSVAFSADDLYVVSGSGDKTVKLWEKQSGTLVKSFESHAAPVKSVGFSGDGHRILSGSEDKTVKLWEKTTGPLVKLFEGHTDFVKSLSFSHDGRYLASASKDGKIKLFEVSTGNLLKVFENHTKTVRSVAFSPDFLHILSGSSDKTVKLWEIPGKLAKTFENHAKAVTSVAFSPDGRHFLSGSKDNTVKLWEKSSGNLLQTFAQSTNSPVKTVGFSPDGGHFFSVCREAITVREFPTGKTVKTLTEEDFSLKTAVFSPDGRYILCAGEEPDVKLLDFSTGNLVRTFRGHKYPVNSVAFSPDGTLVISGSTDKTVKLWEMSTGNLVQSLEGHLFPVNFVAFSPEGRRFASCSDDKTIKIWEKAENQKNYACLLSISPSDTRFCCRNCRFYEVCGLSHVNQEIFANFGAIFAENREISKKID